MKKTAIHFRLASWTIRNPIASYSAVGAIVVGFVLVGMAATRFLGNASTTSMSNGPVFQNQANSNQLEKTGWTIHKQWDQDGVRCINYIKTSNEARLTACYQQINGSWIHTTSY